MPTTCACGRPAPGATLCRACTSDLDRLLAAVPDLLADLDLTLARLDRVGTEVGGGGRHERPLPLNLAAAEARDVLDRTLTAWALAIADEGDTRPLPTPLDAAHELRTHLDALRRLPDAEACVEEVGHAVAHARRAIDLPAPRHYVGDCTTCGTAVRAPLDATAADCTACGTAHDVTAGRLGILDAARGYVLPSRDLVRLLPAYGLRITRHVVDGLVRRGTLAPVGTHADGRPTYRVGDLLDLLNDRKATP